MFQVLSPSHESFILPTILMLAKALEDNGVPLAKSPLHWKPARAGANVLGSLNIRRLPVAQKKEPFFCQLNHAWKNAFYPYVLHHPLVSYTFDCWPYLYDEWQEVFRLNRPKIAFISAIRSVEEMRRRIPELDFRWLPESGDPSQFDGAIPLVNRKIDVLEIGRSHIPYHLAITKALSDSAHEHDYAGSYAKYMLSYTRTTAKYSQAKVVVCFPKSITDPEKAGGVETTTFRYFEAILSKALIVGHCPAELELILGYNPVIEVDFTRPASQLIDGILSRIDEFQSLVDKNHEELSKKWTVDHQATIIVAAMKEISS